MSRASWSSPEQRRRLTKAMKAREHIFYSDRFEAFWKAYPRKDAKRVAWEAWRDLGGEDLDGTLATEIHSAAIKFAKEMRDEGRQQRYIPLPSTWLNQARYENYREKPEDPDEGPKFFFGGQRLS